MASHLSVGACSSSSSYLPSSNYRAKRPYEEISERLPKKTVLQQAFLTAFNITINDYVVSPNIQNVFFHIHAFVNGVQHGSAPEAPRTFRLSKSAEIPSPHTLFVTALPNKEVEILVYMGKQTELGQGRFLITKKARQILVDPNGGCVINDWTVKRSVKGANEIEYIINGIQKHKELVDLVRERFPDALQGFAAIPTYSLYTTKSGEQRLEVFQPQYMSSLSHIQGKSSILLVLNYLRCVAKALEMIHSVGRVHGDISAGNVLVSRFDPPAVISDFDLLGRIGERRPLQDFWLWDHSKLFGHVTPNCDYFAFALLIVDMMAPDIIDRVADIEIKQGDRVLSKKGIPELFMLKLEKFLTLYKEPSLYYTQSIKNRLVRLLKRECENSKRLYQHLQKYPDSLKTTEDWRHLQSALKLSSLNDMLKTLDELQHEHLKIRLRGRNILFSLLP